MTDTTMRSMSTLSFGLGRRQISSDHGHSQHHSSSMNSYSNEDVPHTWLISSLRHGRKPDSNSVQTESSSSASSSASSSEDGSKNHESVMVDGWGQFVDVNIGEENEYGSMALQRKGRFYVSPNHGMVARAACQSQHKKTNNTLWY